MKINGQRHLSVEPETAWSRLLDVETLKRCIPGCEELCATGDNCYQATVSLKIGLVRARLPARCS